MTTLFNVVPPSGHFVSLTVLLWHDERESIYKERIYHMNSVPLCYSREIFGGHLVPSSFLSLQSVWSGLVRIDEDFLDVSHQLAGAVERADTTRVPIRK